MRALIAIEDLNKRFQTKNTARLTILSDERWFTVHFTHFRERKDSLKVVISLRCIYHTA